MGVTNEIGRGIAESSALGRSLVGADIIPIITTKTSSADEKLIRKMERENEDKFARAGMIVIILFVTIPLLICVSIVVWLIVGRKKHRDDEVKIVDPTSSYMS